MRIAVVGKGGSGKTTTAAVVARTIARSGRDVVALDCDSNPNLGISLGVGDDETERLVAMRQALDEGGEEHAPGWELIDRFGADAPDGVRLASCPGSTTRSPAAPDVGSHPEQLLGSVDFEQAVVIADLEAGIGTLTRVAEEAFDTVLVVVEPTAKSLEVGRRRRDGHLREPRKASSWWRTGSKTPATATGCGPPFPTTRWSRCLTTPRSSPPSVKAWRPPTWRLRLRQWSR